MGFKDSLITMLGEFVEQKRNPEFRSKSDLSVSNKSDQIDYPSGYNRVRRHSLNITCGTTSPDDQVIRQRAFSIRNNPARRNTIVPEASIPSNGKTSEPETVEIADVGRTARRFSEPFNSKLPDNFPIVNKRVNNNRTLLSDRPQLSLEESGEESDNSTSERTPATSPRAFQNSFEKRNNRFFAGPSSWRTSAFLDEQPIKEEDAEEDAVIMQEPERKSTIIKITASPCR